MSVFVKAGGKPEYQEKNPPNKARTNNYVNPDMTPGDKYSNHCTNPTPLTPDPHPKRIFNWPAPLLKPLFWFAPVDLHLFVVRAKVIVYVVYLLLRLINCKEPCKRWKSNQDFKMRRFEALSYYFNSRIYRQIKEGRGGWNSLRWSLKIVIRRILSFFHWLRAHHVTCK